MQKCEKKGECEELTKKSNRMAATSGDEKNPTNWTGNLTRSLLCHFQCSNTLSCPQKDNTNVPKQKQKEIFRGYFVSGCVDSDKIVDTGSN
jgi:hypothetical protein